MYKELSTGKTVKESRYELASHHLGELANTTIHWGADGRIAPKIGQKLVNG
jgi:hypothetical protein